MKKFRLLKDLPDAKAGTIFIEDVDPMSPYIKYKQEYNKQDDYHERSSFYARFVVDNPEFFEEVKEEVTAEDVIALTYPYYNKLSCKEDVKDLIENLKRNKFHIVKEVEPTRREINKLRNELYEAYNKPADTTHGAGVHNIATYVLLNFYRKE